MFFEECLNLGEFQGARYHSQNSTHALMVTDIFRGVNFLQSLFIPQANALVKPPRLQYLLEAKVDCFDLSITCKTVFFQ